MRYNLTESQKDTLRWIVEAVRARRLPEQDMVFGYNLDGMWIRGIEGEHPQIEEGVLDVLERNGLLSIRRPDPHSYFITLLEEAYEAVDSDFGISREVESSAETKYPPVIQESLTRFRADHPDPLKVAFIMMEFGKTPAHERIVAGIRSAVEPLGIRALRADDKQYHDDLFPNVLTYIYGCGFGIAVFERLEADDFSPNVSLEVGYMFALPKPVCLLKDSTLRTLPVDLIGRLYREFDPQKPIETIPNELRKWLSDKGIVSGHSTLLSKMSLHPLEISSIDTNEWSIDHYDIFFKALRRDAVDRARREFENISLSNPEKSISWRADEIEEKQVDLLGLRKEFDDRKRENS